MKIISYRTTLLPTHRYICLTCRLQLSYAHHQFRRQQHVDAQPSSSRPSDRIDSVIQSLSGNPRKDKKNSTVLAKVGKNKASQDASSKPTSAPEREFKSPRKPSSEAEELQRHLQEKYIAQRRKQALSKQSPANGIERTKPPRENVARDLKKVPEAVNRLNVTAQTTTSKKLHEGLSQKLLPIRSRSIKKADDHAANKPSKAPEETGSNGKNGLFEQELSGTGIKDSATMGRQKSRPQTLDTKPAKAKRAADTGSTTLKAAVPKKVPDRKAIVRQGAGDAVVRQVAAPGSVRFCRTTPWQLKPIHAAKIQSLKASQLNIVPIEMNHPPVPRLSYGLERVLFNPGVYHLQDPRSRVYNFDPYLQSIMPVAEFDFDALKEYITSSRDTTLKEIADSHNKRYVGSSSSMTGILSHFHFLLSQWRDVNTNMLSREFPEKNGARFTEFQRSPSAVILKWQDGAYAIDADKELASANVLMSLGKSMEKLLTLKTEDFEKYRKSNPVNISTEEQNAPESYHYSTTGDFLMRAQLDAHDPRLPGTGMFDLKTRAVVSVRMDVSNYEGGKGYQIKSRQGAWESFEREYFDMIRAAFLKYSLQVRMGRMDGIFVAFHNTDRIFGFQYISLAEMDSTLHWQWDTSLGDQEFKLSLALLNDVLNKATKKYPNTSLRLHFETREAQTPFMYIFAEPVTEEQVTAIQTANNAKVQEMEQRIFGQNTTSSDSNAEDRGWEDLQANVRDSMDEDILDPNHEDGREDLKPVLSEPSDRLNGDESTSEAHSSESNAGTSGTPLDDDDDVDEDVDENLGEDEENRDEKEAAPEEVTEEVTEEEQGEEPNAHKELRVEHEDAAIDEAILEGEGGQTLDSQDAISERAGSRVPEQPSLSAEDTLEVLGDDAVDQTQDDQTCVNEDTKTQNPQDPDGQVDASLQQAGQSDSIEVEGVPEKVDESQAPEEVSRNDTENPQEPMEDAGDAGSGEFATNADVSFIEGITTREDYRPDGKEVLAMTLTVRNKINGAYVLRPNDLGAKDEWSIEYSLDEVSNPDRAWRLYQACQLRRRKKVDAADRSAETEGEVTGYIERLRQLSRQGAQWRKKQDEQDNSLPVRVLGQEYEAGKEPVTESSWTPREK
ncbi:MAG: hypothetical protein Q9202_005174 [Teloschistes flavicans]